MKAHPPLEGCIYSTACRNNRKPRRYTETHTFRCYVAVLPWLQTTTMLRLSIRSAKKHALMPSSPPNSKQAPLEPKAATDKGGGGQPRPGKVWRYCISVGIKTLVLR